MKFYKFISRLCIAKLTTFEVFEVEFIQMNESLIFWELTLQCSQCAPHDSFRYGDSRSVLRYYSKACRRILQVIRLVKDPVIKQQAYQLYLKGMGMRAIGSVLGIHLKSVSRWLVQAAQSIPASPTQTEDCSFIEIDELFTFIAKKISIKSSALSVEGERSKPTRSSGSRSSTCQLLAMAQTCCSPTRILSHTPSIKRERSSPHKSNHSTGDWGII